MSVPVVAMIHYHGLDSPRRDFYSSATSNDYVTYISKGIDAGKGADRDYMTYMGNPDKSTGVFDRKGILDAERKKELREQLRKAKGNIWDLVISTDGPLGKEKLSSYEQAHSLLCDVLPKLFKRMGFSEGSIIWFAGLHTNTDNRHLHISFFEKEPTFYNQRAGEYRYRRGRVKQEYLSLLKAETEEHLLSSGKSEIKRLQDKVIEDLRSGASPDIFDDSNPLLRSEMRELLETITLTGRHSYVSLSSDIKGHVDAVTTILLSSSEPGREMLSSIARLKKSEEGIRRRYGTGSKGLKADSIEDDLYRRVGNMVISSTIKERNDKFAEFGVARSLRYQRKKELAAIGRLIGRSISRIKKQEYEGAIWFQELLERIRKQREAEKGEPEK